MSRYFSSFYYQADPYIPGEQPQDRQYIKLNTNELPFPPSPLAQRLAREEIANLNLYSDPECKILREKASECFGIDKEEIVFFSGSDDVLNFAVMAFCDESHGLAFPDVTYSFYTSIARLHNIDYAQIKVKEDLSIDPKDYFGLGRTIILANPNAPSGIVLSLKQIKEIVMHNPDNVVIIDEAYIDFGGESALPLIGNYDNLLIVRTFSKGSGMAGARLGYAMGDKELIKDINTLRNSCNPYAVNRMSMMAGVGALIDQSYRKDCIERIQETRQETAEALRKLGFEMTDSKANFLFVKHPDYKGMDLYQDLKKEGILIRHFETERLKDYNRISIGTDEDMKKLVEMIKRLLKEKL